MKQENEAARVELTIVAQAPGLDTPAQAEVIELVSRWGDQLTDDKVAYGAEAGLSDQAAIPAVVVDPGDIPQAHAPDEFVSVEQIVRCEQLIDAVIADARA
jgi:acetylornithine deacetylase